MASMENKIMAALKTKLEELAFLKSVTFDRIRLTGGDFQPQECPGVQIYDLIEPYTHSQQRVKTQWQIVVEYYQKTLHDGSHDQATLMDNKFAIERKIGENLKLDIVSVPDDGRIWHIKYIQSQTSFFLIDGMTTSQMQFEILFEKPYSGLC